MRLARRAPPRGSSGSEESPEWLILLTVEVDADVAQPWLRADGRDGPDPTRTSEPLAARSRASRGLVRCRDVAAQLGEVTLRALLAPCGQTRKVVLPQRVAR